MAVYEPAGRRRPRPALRANRRQDRGHRRPWRRHRRADAAIAQCQAPDRTARRRSRARWRLVARTADRGAEPLCRGGARGGSAAPASPGGVETSGGTRRSERAAARHRPDRAWHGKAGRRRVELFERHRPDPVFRSGEVAGDGARRRAAVFRPARARSCPDSRRTHRRRLCLPHRFAAAPRPGLDPAGDVDRGRDGLLRECWPELGTRGLDQGAPGRRRPDGRRAVFARVAALYLAQASRFRGDPGHSFDQAPDQRVSRRRPHRGRRPRHQDRPRRHPRDRVLCPDAAADLGRARP